MKKLVIFLMILFANTVFAQDKEPGQVKFNYYGSLRYLSADMPEFTQNKYYIGFHWGAPKRISEAIDANQFDGDIVSRPDDLIGIIDSCNLFCRPPSYSHSIRDEFLNVRAIQYEPTLELDPNHPENFVLRHGDTTHPIFGFRYRRGRFLSDSSEENFNRRIIDSAILAGSIILDNPWPEDRFNRNVF